jgi:cytosine/adenosine deaminase-related metal-dependent hydrolase
LRTLLYNARLVAAMDDRRKEILDGFVLVQDDRIDAVGEGTLPGTLKVDRTIDMRGRVVLPGLVNTHHHLPQTLTRNVPPLFKWLQELY